MSFPTSSSTRQTTAVSSATEAVITQLSVGPDLRDVAAVLLRKHLRELYPTLDLEPSITMLGSPSWGIIDDEIVAGSATYLALTEVLANQVVHGIPALYIEGEHFLTQQPVSEPAEHLPVRIDEIASLINLLAPVMLTAFQEQQLVFWNSTDDSKGPRWHALSASLRSIWNVDTVQGWSEADCAMAQTFYRTPDVAGRKREGPGHSNAYLIAINLVDDENVKRLNEVSIVVLVGKQQERTVILTHSLLKGFQRFDSMQELGETLPEHISPGEPYSQLQWQLLEPLGNIFDYQACTLVSIQIDVIGSLDFSTEASAQSIKQLSTSTPKVDEAIKKGGPSLDWFKDALPDWLGSASLPDLNNYSRHLKDLTALHSQNTGKSYLDGILPISEYALSELNALHDEKLREHADALHKNTELETSLESIQLQVKSPVIWGTFVVPGKVDTFNFSVPDLALQNLIAVPLGNKSLFSTRGKTLPEWLTVSYLEDLVTRADIGTTYPALIKSQLLATSVQTTARQALFAQHLRIQLPLLALQCKIRGESGIDARGYRYVVAVMGADADDRKVQDQTIVIRPLAFVPKRRSSGAQDEVANMFVIGPEDPSAGPCLLYRPMLDQPLTQYPSPSNLLYAIQQSASLRDSVLAWLPDTVRSDYANYVFPSTVPSPWTVTEFLVDPEKLLIMSGPISLGKKALQGDLPLALFKANAQALVEQADRQSVSNAESRWSSFQRAGWMLFNAVLPFLGRTVGIAAWIWQVMDQLQELREAHEQRDTGTQWSALTDLLLNLAMAIILHITTHGRSRQRTFHALPTSETPTAVKAVAPKIIFKQLEKSAPHEVAGLQQTVSISGATNRTPENLSAVLQRFKINRPEGMGPANAEEGLYRHLYSHNRKWFAPVGSNWFEVSVDDNGTVLIIDSQQPTHTGPALIGNLRGEWFVDVRLRLRGGGSTGLTRLAEAERQFEAAKLRARLTEFESRKTTAQSELEQARQAMSKATTETVEAKRRQFLETLETQRATYAQALSDLKALHVFSPTADFQQKALGYLKAQLELTHAGIREVLTVFTPKLRSVLNHIDRQAEARQERHITESLQMIELNQDMIARLGHIRARVVELKAFEREGLRLIQHTRKALPAYSIEDLKAFQVTLARNACLPEHSVATVPDAWQDLDRIVDSAEIAVQTLRDTLDERSVPRLDERIDTLNGLIDQFNVLDERLGDFKTTYSEHIIETALARLRRQLEQFNLTAKRNLAVVLEERDILRSRPMLRPFTPRPKKIFIRTRYNGMLIGEVRLTAQGLETDLVDITSPLTNKVIATFHQKTPGVWVERVNTAAAPAATPALETSLNKGQALIDSMATFTTRMNDLIKQTGRSPGGIEYLFHQHAQQMEQISSDIDQALTDSNATDSRQRSAAVVNKGLNDAAESLYQQASAAMLKMTKEQAPTLSGVGWLNDNHAISIAKSAKRRPVKGGKRLYLDEYTITDRTTREPLWYAHFLYSTSWVPNKAFLSARLKTARERSLPPEADNVASQNETERLAYYRSMIGLEQATRMFFSKD